jgi:hypothetical protein
LCFIEAVEVRDVAVRRTLAVAAAREVLLPAKKGRKRRKKKKMTRQKMWKKFT